MTRDAGFDADITHLIDLTAGWAHGSGPFKVAFVGYAAHL